MVPFLLFFLAAFSTYRANVPADKIVKAIIWKMSFTRSDPAGPMVSILHELNKDAPLILGNTYTNIFTIFTPKIFFPNRPLDLAEKFAKEMIVNWKPGQGLAFSPLAEAYMNFGYYGALIQYFIFGMIWSGVWGIVRRCFFKEFFESYLVFYYVVGLSTLILTFRSSFSAFPKILLMNIAPFLLVLFVAKRMKLNLCKNKKINL